MFCSTPVMSAVARPKTIGLARLRFPNLLIPVIVSATIGMAVSFTGCKDLTGSPGLPAGIQNPGYYSNKAGALGMRTAALYNFEQALAPHIVATGLLTDELEDWQTNASAGVLSSTTGITDGLDERFLSYGTANALSDNDYAVLQLARTDITQALAALAAFDTAPGDTASARAMRSELYALSGYVDILLADLFCSGVPLSTLQFQQDFTYGASLSTTQLYHVALATLDTALTLAKGNDSVQSLARVGQGRVYTDLGQYPVAADDVALVPVGFQYLFSVQWTNILYHYQPLDYLNAYATVSDREGRNGLPYRSSGDPRTADTLLSTSDPNSGLPLGVPAYFPDKYVAGLTGQGFAPFVLASGVEARLIQAEAAYHTNANDGHWLALLNALRTTGSFMVSADPVTGQPDTLWQAGTGAVSGLRPLSDPGSANNNAARESLLFAERAAWLFLTGERQGDLRRRVRVYGRASTAVYPVGTYTAPGAGVYGNDVNAPVPSAEENNPHFHGCLDRRA